MNRFKKTFCIASFFESPIFTLHKFRKFLSHLKHYNLNLIYIVCPGHSGSTLLDIMLGIHKDVFSTGELVHLPNQYHRNKLYAPSPLNGLSCSCGTDFFNCKFWGKIIKLLDEKLSYDVIESPLKFKTAFLMSHSIPHRHIIHKIGRRCTNFIIKNRLSFFDEIFEFYFNSQIKNNELLVELIHDLSGKKYIIDSTKDMYRLHYLLKANLNIKVIVLKRNILGVSASAKKLNSNPIKTARHWLKYYTNLDTILKYNKIEPLIIKYEDLVNHPINELNRIFKFAKLYCIEYFPDLINTNDYHIVAGNGLRYRGKITIRKDETWKEILTSEEKMIINGMQQHYFS